jgi:hypothetical protein
MRKKRKGNGENDIKETGYAKNKAYGKKSCGKCSCGKRTKRKNGNITGKAACGKLVKRNTNRACNST